MKNSRNKDLREIRLSLINLNEDVIFRMEEIRSKLEDLYSELEEQYDNLSERSQENEVGEKVQDDMNDVEYILSDVTDIAEADKDDTESSVFASIFEMIDELLEKGS